MFICFDNQIIASLLVAYYQLGFESAQLQVATSYFYCRIQYNSKVCWKIYDINCSYEINEHFPLVHPSYLL